MLTEPARATGLLGACACLLLAAGCGPADRRDAPAPPVLMGETERQPRPETDPADAATEPGGDREAFWSGLGLMMTWEPQYEGAQDYGARGYPIIDLPVGDPVLLDARNGLGLYVLNASGVKIGVAAGYRFGRDEDAADNLTGLGDVRGGLTANAVVQWQVGDFRLGALLERQVTGDENGSLIELTARYDLQLKRGPFLRSTAVAVHADNGYMDSYFGVTADQSRRSDLSAFSADPGIKSVGLRERLVLRVSKRWSLHALLEYHRLLSDAADSPISREDDQFLLGWGAACRF